MGPELQAHQVEGLPLGWGHLVANWGHRLRPAVPAGAALQALPIRSAKVACPLMGMLTYPLQPSTTSEISGRELPAAVMPREDPLSRLHRHPQALRRCSQTPAAPWI